MEVEGNRTTRNTSKPAQTADGTDIQTDRQTYRQTFFLLLFWGCGRLIRPQKKS